MSSMTPYKTMKKRPLEDSSPGRPQKSPFGHLKTEDGIFFDETKTFKFRILMPNGTTLELKKSVVQTEMSIGDFINDVQNKYATDLKQRNSEQPKRRINWKYQDIHFTDAGTNKKRSKINFHTLLLNEWNILCLHDGSAEPNTYEGMWDLTPDTDLLKELPDDYTPETALADLIDNSLQALWSNVKGEIRLISIELHPDRISIFDSGPGMDGAHGNLVKWGKMGASLHRSVRERAIGGKPPYLTPYFGMFGYGGPVATMCLGRRAVVSSKTKNCDKVFTLHLEREELMKASSSENCWRTKGGMRDPTKNEKKNSPHGSFTKVEIFEPHKKKTLDIKRIQCQLKDIYFPYIQCEDPSGKTIRLVDFQVNGKNLTEIWGEVAITLSHSCNGQEFAVEVRFSINDDPSLVHGQSQKVLREANASLKCVYFPLVEGKESIDLIIEELKASDSEFRGSFESFRRVAVRRLGRLLPDTRWDLLPFMEPKQKKGEKAQLLKICSSRVKCFIDTDSGFNPTPHKTDLAQHHPYTEALKNLGNRAPENEKEVQIEIIKDGKKLTLGQLEKQFFEWVADMHDRYDVDMDSGVDEPIIIVVSSKIEKLHMPSGVLRLHRKINRRGKSWTAGQNIKVLRGACPGFHSNNEFVTLEYIILKGLPGDASGDAWLVCRPIGLPEQRGCHLFVEDGNNKIDFRDSQVLPIRVINSEKFLPADENEWGTRLAKCRQKLPSVVELLNHKNYQELEIEGGLPCVVKAGDAPPENIVAVIRPKTYDPGNSPNSLDQKLIVKDKHEMSLNVKFRAGVNNVGKEGEHVFSMRKSPSSHKDLQGLYLFPVKLKHPKLFEKAGFYTFSFAVNEHKDVRFEQEVHVQASAVVGSWNIIGHNLDELYTIRVGSCLDPLSVVCYDKYDNCIPFTSVPKLTINLSSNSTVLDQIRSMKVGLTTDKSIMKIKDVVINCNKLDDIRPVYKASLDISSQNEVFSVALPCRVLPGTPEHIIAHPRQLRKQLIPGQIIEELKLELFDKFRNHAKEDENILLSVDGFIFQDGSGVVHDKNITCLKKVNADGFVDLSNILKVSKGYGKDVSLSVLVDERVILKLNSKTETRKLQSVQKVFKNCEAGSQLENIVFEIINSEDKVDESINDEEKNGQSHTLTIKSNSFDIDDSVRYSFRRGRCTIRSIPLPQTQGTFFFSATHSRFPELNLDLKVHVKEASRQENRDFTGNYEDAGNPVQSSTPNHEDVGNLVPTPRNSCENLEIPSSSKDLRVGNGDFSPQISKGYASPVGYSPVKTPKSKKAGAQNECLDIVNLKEMGDDLAAWGLKMGDHEKKLKILTSSQSQIQRQISILQASIDRDLPNVSSMCGQEWISEQIKTRTQSTAAVVCKLFHEESFESRPQGLIGVVALLGTTSTINLSRVLAKYLGEDQMLATVYENYEAANDLVTNGLHKLASEVGQSTSGGLALCLDDIRPYRLSNIGPENLLPLKPPTLPGGGRPQGFVGYAVNMIGIETRTGSGRGLRETLFYSLFGELQVYRDRECMMKARSCIKDGAVSLNGGIVKGNGLIALGHWEPAIIFPVKNYDVAGAQTSQNLQLLEERKLDLIMINQQLEQQSKASEKDREMLVSSRDRYNRHRSSQSVSSSAPRSSQQSMF